ncbi:MAG: YjjG family noncanonical pyrimidine nucleotidase [Eubacteriales bacterium]
MKKNRYRAIFFDADRTLFDFDSGEENALRTLLDGIGVTLDAEMLEAYRKINRFLWNEFEHGKIAKNDIAPRRFREFLSLIGAASDPCKTAEKYIGLLSEQRALLPGAKDICEYLSGKYVMYIVTNGMAEIQLRRFSKSEIIPFFREVFISESLGAAKPDRAFYDEALKRAGVGREEVLAVGDSPSADILGANRAGIDACYFSPDRLPLPEGLHAEYSISMLSELADFL